MTVKEKIDTPKKGSETCMLGTFTYTRNKQRDRRSTSVLKLVYTDSAGCIEPVDINGHWDSIIFIDDFSSTVFMCFLKSKNDTESPTKKFKDDSASYGRIRSLRYDNVSEFKSNDF